MDRFLECTILSEATFSETNFFYRANDINSEGLALIVRDESRNELCKAKIVRSNYCRHSVAVSFAKHIPAALFIVMHLHD